MKHSSNSYKHNPTTAKQPRDFRSRTSTITRQNHGSHDRIPVDNHSDQPVLRVYDHSSPFADFMRLVICMLAGMALVALLVPVGFAADERYAATAAAGYIPVVSTATEPVLTAAVAEVYTQEAPTSAMPYRTATVSEGETLNKTVWTGVGIIAVMICCNMWHNVILTKELKDQIKELSDKIDATSTPSDKP